MGRDGTLTHRAASYDSNRGQCRCAQAKLPSQSAGLNLPDLSPSPGPCLGPQPPFDWVQGGKDLVRATDGTTGNLRTKQCVGQC